MFDDILKLDLDKVPKTKATFVVFPDGRTVLSNDYGHSRTVMELIVTDYPEIYNELPDNFKDLSSPVVLSSDWMSRHGIVVVYNVHDYLCLYENQNINDKQKYSLTKLKEKYKFINF